MFSFKNHQYHVIFLITFSFFVLLLVNSCADLAGMDSHSKISRFQHAEKVYRASMRWGEWNEIFHIMKEKEGSNEPLETSNEALKAPSAEYLLYLDTIKVKDVNVLGTSMDKKLGSGTSKFKIGYRFDNSLKINYILHTVDWWYHAESNQWFTDTGLPKAFAMPKSRTIKLSPKH